MTRRKPMFPADCPAFRTATGRVEVLAPVVLIGGRIAHHMLTINGDQGDGRISPAFAIVHMRDRERWHPLNRAARDVLATVAP